MGLRKILEKIPLDSFTWSWYRKDMFNHRSAILSFSAQFPKLEDHPSWHDPEDQPFVVTFGGERMVCQNFLPMPGNMG